MCFWCIPCCTQHIEPPLWKCNNAMNESWTRSTLFKNWWKDDDNNCNVSNHNHIQRTRKPYVQVRDLLMRVKLKSKKSSSGETKGGNSPTSTLLWKLNFTLLLAVGECVYVCVCVTRRMCRSTRCVQLFPQCQRVRHLQTANIVVISVAVFIIIAIIL